MDYEGQHLPVDRKRLHRYVGMIQVEGYAVVHTGCDILAHSVVSSDDPGIADDSDEGIVGWTFSPRSTLFSVSRERLGTHRISRCLQCDMMERNFPVVTASSAENRESILAEPPRMTRRSATMPGIWRR